MGTSQKPLVVVDSKQAKRRWLGKKKQRVMKKIRGRLDGSSRISTRKAVERKVRTLKKLIPNSTTSEESMALGGLFRETAGYILSLQMRVRVMQIMVKMLSGSDDQ